MEDNFCKFCSGVGRYLCCTECSSIHFLDDEYANYIREEYCLKCNNDGYYIPLEDTPCPFCDGSGINFKGIKNKSTWKSVQSLIQDNSSKFKQEVIGNKSFDFISSEIIKIYLQHHPSLTIEAIKNAVALSIEVKKAMFEFGIEKKLPSFVEINQILETAYFFKKNKEYLDIGGLHFLINWNLHCNKNNSIISNHMLGSYAIDYIKSTRKM